MQGLRLNDEVGEFAMEEGVAETPPIYGSFFRLRERPFTLTANPRFLFLSRRQREALSSLRYGLTTPLGFTLLTGDAGCGKTTMLRTVLAELSDSKKTRCALLTNPTLTRPEFNEFLSRAFGLSESAAVSKTRFLEEMQSFLEMRLAEGCLTGLVIDEAQSLPDELLEEIRLLGNIETASTKLLNIVLAAQPELLDRLQDPALRPLKQRIALRCELKTFDLSETAAYIAGRLRIAGGSPAEIFTQEAVMVIHEATRGLPRTVNVLCENALITGFADQIKPVPARIVKEVAGEFQMRDVPSARGDEPQSGGPPETANKSKNAKKRFSFR